MRNTVLLAIFIHLATFALAQNINTLFSNENANKTTYGGYGGPFVQASQLNDTWGVMVGGKGGVVVNRQFAFGGIGMGTSSHYEFTGTNLSGNVNADLDLIYGAGGFYIEYISKIENPIHFSIPVNLMVGGVAIEENNREVESSDVFIFEPGVNIEFNFSQYFIPGLNISYRQVFGSSLDNLDDQDLSGLNIGLMLKFGSF